jgi:hypothetical protein
MKLDVSQSGVERLHIEEGSIVYLDNQVRDAALLQAQMARDFQDGSKDTKMVGTIPEALWIKLANEAGFKQYYTEEAMAYVINKVMTDNDYKHLRCVNNNLISHSDLRFDAL